MSWVLSTQNELWFQIMIDGIIDADAITATQTYKIVSNNVGSSLVLKDV